MLGSVTAAFRWIILSMDKSFRKDLAAQLAAITESRQMKASDLTNPEKAFKRHITGPREIPAEPELLIQEMVGSAAFHTLWPPYSFLNNEWNNILLPSFALWNYLCIFSISRYKLIRGKLQNEKFHPKF